MSWIVIKKKTLILMMIVERSFYHLILNMCYVVLNNNWNLSSFCRLPHHLCIIQCSQEQDITQSTTKIRKGLNNASLTALNLIFLNTSQSQKEMKKKMKENWHFYFLSLFFRIYDLLFVVVLFVTKYLLYSFPLPSLTNNNNKKRVTIERIFHFQTIFSIILTWPWFPIPRTFSFFSNILFFAILVFLFFLLNLCELRCCHNNIYNLMKSNKKKFV